MLLRPPALLTPAASTSAADPAQRQRNTRYCDHVSANLTPCTLAQVPLVQWMSLGKIKDRLHGKGDCLYLRATDMIADFHQIAQNAEMYNAPGNGKLGNRGALCSCAQAAWLQAAPQTSSVRPKQPAGCHIRSVWLLPEQADTSSLCPDLCQSALLCSSNQESLRSLDTAHTWCLAADMDVSGAWR